MLPCPKCGYNNELGRIFCHQCGQKLDLDAIKPPSRGGKSLKPKSKNLVAKLIRRVLGLMVLGAVLYLVYVMLQVVPEPAKPTAAETTAADKKWLAVERLVGKRQTGSVEVSPAEARAFLAALKLQKTDTQWGCVPDRIWIEFAADSVELNILTTMRLGGVLERQVWITYTGAPKTQNGQFTFEAKGGTFGRLKWPLGLVNALGFHRGMFGKLLEGLKMEKETLSQLSQIEVRAGRAILSYQPR